jgi:hypothetical protein
MKPTVAACAHLLVVAQWRLVNAELDAGVELDATKWRGGHPWSIDLSSGRNKWMDRGNDRRHAARGMGEHNTRRKDMQFGHVRMNGCPEVSLSNKIQTLAFDFFS